MEKFFNIHYHDNFLIAQYTIFNIKLQNIHTIFKKFNILYEKFKMHLQHKKLFVYYKNSLLHII